MKKALFIAVALLGMQATVKAQVAPIIPTDSIPNPSTYTDDKPGHGLYVSFGVAGFDDFKMNDRLKAVGMPELNKAAFETTVGFYVMFRKMSFDMEFAASYMDQKTATDRVRNINGLFRFRGHYNILMDKNFFVTAGADLTFASNNFNINTRNRTIDLHNPDPADYTGHINLYNQQMYIGPSVAFGFLQSSEYKLRLNMGYEWAVISSEWKSQYANVQNTFRESGQGHYYAKLSIMLY
jgi:hypothetical protein